MTNQTHTVPIQKDTKEESIANFLSGREPLPNAGFTFNDDVWNLSYRETRATRISGSRIVFDSFPNWMKPTIKEYFVNLWLVRKLANATLQNLYMRSILEFAKFLETNRPDITKVRDFDETVARGYEQWIALQPYSAGAKAQRYVGVVDFSRWARGKLQGSIQSFYLRNGLFPHPVTNQTTYLISKNKVIPQDVMEQVMKSLVLEEARLWEAIERRKKTKGKRAKKAYTQLLYCQVLKLLVATGRRISSILRIGRNPIQEPRPDEAAGVWIVYPELKTRQANQRVFVPEPLSDIVREAIQIALDVTNNLTFLTNETDRKYLFLMERGEHSHIIDAHLFTNWLNGYKPYTDDPRSRLGFVHRYNIQHNGERYLIRPHNFRHSRATQLRSGGAGYGTIKNDLLHVSADMTGVYIHAHEAVAKEFQTLRETRSLLGKAMPLIESKVTRVTGFSNRELDLWREQGMFVQTTAYGYCILPQEKGVCPIGEPCWIGDKGDGCNYHLFGPKHRAEMDADAATIKSQRDKLLQERPNSPLVGHYNTQLKRYESIIRDIEKKEKEGEGSGE